MYHFKVFELRGPISHRMTYGILAEAVEDGVCTYAACIPDISPDKAFVDALAQRCAKGQLNPIHLMDVVLDAIS